MHYQLLHFILHSNKQENTKVVFHITSPSASQPPLTGDTQVQTEEKQFGGQLRHEFRFLTTWRPGKIHKSKSYNTIHILTNSFPPVMKMDTFFLAYDEEGQTLSYYDSCQVSCWTRAVTWRGLAWRHYQTCNPSLSHTHAVHAVLVLFTSLPDDRSLTVKCCCFSCSRCVCVFCVFL